ncbi:Rhs family protein [Enterovibrio norvegicus]|uniref:Rhs family protein n=1 Tax=Enterovibrio norvegicus TaxID=188144 RepID=UPI000C837E85|nr:Rhs family protein [Enterovibrio norvegicus]PMN72384.1 Rhs family protein [Enterovibrio norvegicus]
MSNTTMTMGDVDKMFSNVKSEFENSIEDYRKKADSWIYGWALEMDQKIFFNDKSRSSDIDSSTISADVIACPNDGKVTLVHAFEAEKFIPITGTPFKIQAVEKKVYTSYRHGTSTTSYNPTGPSFKGNIDDNGFAEVKLGEEFRGKLIRVYFYPDVSESDVKAMLDSYDPTISKLSEWLDGKWESQRNAWESFIVSGYNYSDEVLNFLNDMVDAVVDAWDEIADLFKLLANPTKLKNMLSKYVENPEIIADMLANAKKEASEMLSLLKDEARCFLCIKAVFAYFRILTPLQIAAIVSVTLASLLVEVIISIVIPGGAILKNMNRLRDAAGAASMIKA